MSDERRGDRPRLAPARGLGRRLSRRGLVSAATGLVAGALVGCGGDEPGGGSPPTSSPEPEVTLALPPLASPVAGYLDPSRWQGRSLTVASQGGDYQQAQADAYFGPFQVATGASIAQDTTVLGELRRQVDDEAVQWDLVCLPTEDVLPLARDGYLRPIDYSVVDDSVLFSETGIVMQYGVGADFFSTVIIGPAGATSPGLTWADVWDPGVGLPGRSLRRFPAGTLEFALIADGVALADLYPLDVERAFVSLRRIAPSVAVWYEDSKQPVELVVNGEVGLASAWNVRTTLPDARGQIGISWAGGMLSGDSWVVPAGAPNADVAMSLVNYATRAVPTANFSRLIPFGPVNREALALLTPAERDGLPTAESHLAVQFVENWNYWVDNRERLGRRFDTWLEGVRQGAEEPAP
ncbi:MAG: extracellular solute-binding protein [Thermomicrobiales bacterium]